GDRGAGARLAALHRARRQAVRALQAGRLGRSGGHQRRPAREAHRPLRQGAAQERGARRHGGLPGARARRRALLARGRDARGREAEGLAGGGRGRGGKPVFASLGNVAASGGYYVASAANKILADPGTITGSIGAIMSVPYYAPLADKLGISEETVKSGRYKDTGHPLRKLTPEERTL